MKIIVARNAKYVCENCGVGIQTKSLEDELPPFENDLSHLSCPWCGQHTIALKARKKQKTLN